MRYCYYAAFVLALAACSEKPAATSAPAALPRPSAVDIATKPAPGARPDTAVARQPLARAQLPAALRPPGRLLEAWRWTDARGENTLVAARTVSLSADQQWQRTHPGQARPANDSTVSLDDAARTARLLVRQYVRHGTDYQPLWQLQDAEAACPLDLTLGLLPGSTRVSDLDGDGRTETILVYALGCRGGVDPAALKLIMHEGAAKYALRGLAIQPLGGPADMARARRLALGPVCCAEGIPDSASQRLEGLYATEKDFVEAPPAFLAFARQQWRHWRTRADQGTAVR